MSGSKGDASEGGVDPLRINASPDMFEEGDVITISDDEDAFPDGQVCFGHWTGVDECVTRGTLADAPPHDDGVPQLGCDDDDDGMDAVAFLCTSFAIPGEGGDEAMDVDRGPIDVASGREELGSRSIVPYSVSDSGRSRASVIQQARETVIHQARESVLSGTCVPANAKASVPAAVDDAEGARAPDNDNDDEEHGVGGAADRPR